MDRSVIAVLDPLDGTTNWARGLPVFGPSICAGDRSGPRCAVVVDAAHGRVFEAIRGAGLRLDDERISVRADHHPPDLLVASSLGADPDRAIWTRGFGAAAHELCLVATGALDGFVSSPADELQAWDVLGGMLIVAESGGDVPALDPTWRAALDGRPTGVVVAGRSRAVTARLTAFHDARSGVPGPDYSDASRPRS
jgi:myo-inositol-1(or 4)-monophosphatase